MTAFAKKLIDPVATSPLFPELLEELYQRYQREKALREKFYDDITPEHKWEFINGEVIMHSPALAKHLRATIYLVEIMRAYVRTRQLGEVLTEKALCCFPRNDYEPDIVFFGLAKAASIMPDTLKFPVPDLIVEVLTPSAQARDRGIKQQDYALHGVKEYWIVDAENETVEVLCLPQSNEPKESLYLPAEVQKNGFLRSQVILGLEISVKSIFDEYENAVTLRRMWA